MNKSKYKNQFDELKGLICDINENELKDQIDRGKLISTALNWREIVEKKISEIEKIVEKLERENLGLKQTNLNQHEKIGHFYGRF